MNVDGGRIEGGRIEGARIATKSRSARAWKFRLGGGASPADGSRIAGIDVARGFAIIGMFAAHAIPRADNSELLVDGRPSILFATLAGVSLGIMTGSTRPPGPGRRGDPVVGILVRALIIFLLGVTLAVLDSEVAVILDFYAVMFLLMTPMLFFPRWALGALAAVLAVAAPALAAVVYGADRDAPALLEIAQYYLLTGNYPALVWLPFLLVGLISARSGLGRARTQLWMIASGTAAAVLGYGGAALLQGVTAEAHSGSTAEVVGSGGFAVAFIGVMLWLTSAERGGFGVAVGWITRPIGATGSMPLTIYTLQVITLTVFADLRERTDGAIQYPGWPLLIGMTIASLLFATLWRRFLGKGPLERMLAAASRAPAPANRQPDR